MFSDNVQDFLLKITKRNDIVLAIFLVMIAFLMILPIPTFVIDILIGINLSGAILLLMIGVYMPSPLAFASFPSVLLLTTMFRLALSISTTRLILLQADAGAIVTTFGEFVVGGNIVVGFVIFFIITIVQFIVITKGSERIAEVSARFSLDAMPGKQMSIDSDLRSGTITMDEARVRRNNLEKGSQLYGSMDGAMKFVKGDAIAGMVIIFVNILGGISVGMMQQNMSFGDAGALYSILTIGDGLVSQIPALFISITAGIIVSRVTTDENTNLGQDIGNQMMSQPNALLIASGVVFIMGLIPGFPFIVFLFLSFVLGLAGLLMRQVQAHQFEEAGGTSLIGANISDQARFKAAESSNKSDDEEVSPVLVELTDQARQHLTPEDLHNEFTAVRKKFYLDMGIPIPGIRFRLMTSMQDEYKIFIQSIPVAQGQLGLGQVFVNETSENLNNKQIPHQAGENFLPGLPTVWVAQEQAENLQNQKIKTLNPAQILAFHLSSSLRQHASEFVGVQEVHMLFNKLERQGFGELIREAQGLVPLPKITDVLRRLVAEGISIRDLRQILESIIERGETEKDIPMLAEYVRMGLKRQISHKFSNGSLTLPVYLLEPETENAIKGSIRQLPTGSFLDLAPEVSDFFIQTLKNNEEAAQNQADLTARPVVLTSMELRRHLSTYFASKMVVIPVLAFQELTSEVRLNPLGRLQVSGN
ncbi:MAG TPA: EscV/YscV/HrcV family type III secretion system export apparatus protein [Leucothrix mucor]|uniref:EscV/YscV/HrcV family type III secretion system export apparatus protein n=1 Tax=Leucothrix mucor TaxID=45248 RepID=A0A7V2SZ73_LEUMU|nr:EscV/YscV/HrcV family type III secretion system export apparatus protein [Leucothrix mucor]